MAEVEFSSDPETETVVMEAISGIMRERRGEIVNRGILIVEVIDAEGDRGMWVCETEGMATWDERALLGFALDKVRDIDLIRRMKNRMEDD